MSGRGLGTEFPVSQKIEDYGPIGDLHTMALVGRDGSIDWLCLPRFDSGACFARLVGDEDNGYWRIAPASGGSCTSRRYWEDTLILETEWQTPEGTVRLIDVMPPRDQNADVVRFVEGVSGRVSMRMELRLRFDYGHIIPWVKRHDDGRLSAIAGPDSVWLDTPVDTRGENMTTIADFEIAAGQTIPFRLSYHPSHETPPQKSDPRKLLDDAKKYWLDWTGQCDYKGGWPDAVRRSLITLKGLIYEPTGGIVAAATTSLPEQIGGPRNWDYRYCWLRDATFTLQALLGTGYTDEAAAWRDWLLRAVAGDPADLQIMYGIDGRRRLTEFTLDWLNGYENSRPVRVGNAAVDQLQLDVWGEVLQGLQLAREAGLSGVTDAWDLQRKLLEFLEGHWQDLDNSLWEMRGPARSFVHSKVMAWAGIDSAVKAVERFGVSGPLDRWKVLRAQIHGDVCDRGYDASRNTFTQYYGSKGLDAALLLIPQTGFLPWHDERVIGTVEAVQRELCEDGFVLRYRTETGIDGLPGDEAAFLACSFWLVDGLNGIGRTAEARSMFECLLGLRNDLGILSEEFDPRSTRQVGNTPQAFSHVGLVNSARHLSGTRPASATRAKKPTKEPTLTSS